MKTPDSESGAADYRGLFGAPRHCLSASLLLGALLALQLFFSSGIDRPRADELRYANYAVNLANHHTFGLSPEGSTVAAEPGNANGPLYPLFLAALIKLDESVGDNLVCALEDIAEAESCSENFTTATLVQYGLGLICLLLLWFSCQLIFANPVLATSVALCAGLSGVYSGYAERLLTEIMILPLFAAIQLCLLLVVKKRQMKWAVACGVFFGLLALTRPEGMHLMLLMAGVIGAWFLFGRQLSNIKWVIAGVMAFIITVSPWMLRNQLQFGSPALTTGGYGETILAYRLSFNRLTTAEWVTAFVYWLPDFGDKLAQTIFSEPNYRRLISDNPDSFIATAKGDILQPALDSMPREEIIGHWLKTEIFGEPLNHLRTSIPIFWRGIWVAKYWGIIGLFSYLVLLFKLRGAQRWAVFWFSLPAWLLVVLHAGISINIPRYNLPLVPVYALGWGWLVASLFSRKDNKIIDPAG